MAKFGSPTTPQDYEIPMSLPDTVQDLAWSPTSNLLVDGAWDNNVRCWEIQHQGEQMNALPKAQISHKGPVLCTAFHSDGSAVFSGSTDKTAQMWQLGGAATGQQVAAHDAPIRGLSYIKEANCLVTGSWDKTVKYWDLRAPTAQATVQLPGKVLGLDVQYPLMVVITSDRQECMFNLTDPSRIYKTRQSTLKYQLKSVACYPEKDGYAVGSIEGRISFQSVEDKTNNPENFAFKCHRGDNKEVYQVNSINFHPLGTFAAAGGDGEYRFWDRISRSRLHFSGRTTNAITVGKFNASGSLYAYAVGNDWSKGSENYNPQQQKNCIRLHNVKESEVAKKVK